MFKDLLNYFDLEKNNNFLTMITSSTLDGSFLIHHLLSCGLKANNKIYFLSASQTWAHYKSVQIKLGNGTSFTEMVDKSKLINFDLMNLSNDFLNGDNNNLETKMKNIFIDIKSKLETSTEKALIIIDDLSVLNLIGCKENFIFEFMSNIRAFSDRINLVIYSQMLMTNQALLNDLIFLANSHIVADRLVTGYSKDIQGQVS